MLALAFTCNLLLLQAFNDQSNNSFNSSNILLHIQYTSVLANISDILYCVVYNYYEKTNNGENVVIIITVEYLNS